MKRSLAMMTCALCGVMVFGSFSPVMAAGAKAATATVKEDSAEETKEEKTETSEDTALEDGTYVAEFDSDSGMFHANEANDGKGILTVKDGEMTFYVSLASKHIVNLFVGTAEDAQKDGAKLLEPTTDTVTYSDGMTEEVYGFDIPVENIDDIIEFMKTSKASVIGIDEVQFIKGDICKIVETLNLFLENGFTIVLAGLDMDFKAEPFELVKELMPRADYLYKHHAVCANCGVDAWVSYRKTQDDERIKLGASESYEPLCRKCYYEKEKLRKQMENQLSMLDDK